MLVKGKEELKHKCILQQTAATFPLTLIHKNNTLVTVTVSSTLEVKTTCPQTRFMDKDTLWKTVLARLEIDLSPVNFKTWFAGTKIVKKDGPIFVIGCPTSYTKDRLERYYQAQIKSTLDKLSGEDTNLVFKVQASAPPTETSFGPLFKEDKAAHNTVVKKSGLFPQYTFENFVVGNNNNLAFAVAQGIVEEPGKRHNPFFIYSKVGLGKTHLIQAIGNEILRKHPHLKVLYTTSENFTNQLIQAIQNRTTTNFKQRFRTVDVLLIDDTQFLAGRESSQEEFFHTFNTLFMEQKQIALASDRPLKDISKLEKRLSSRFSSGMIADMQSPDVDVRLAILRKKRELSNLEIPDDVLALIAEVVPSNIRELEGALNRIITIAQTKNTRPHLKLAEEILGQIPEKAPPDPERVVSEVCTYFALKPKELRGRRRPARIVLPRQITMYLLRNLTDMSLTEIGDILGGRDHTTVIHGVEKIKKVASEDLGVREQIQVIKTQICG